MRWIEGDDFRWVRPLREITCLLNGKRLLFQVAQLTAGNKKEVRDFADYQKTMREKISSLTRKNAKTKYKSKWKKFLGKVKVKILELKSHYLKQKISLNKWLELLNNLNYLKTKYQ